MGWLDAAGATGFGVSTLLGTPEQQREDARRKMEFGQNLAMRQQAADETKRQHDLQNQMFDETPIVNAYLKSQGKPELPPGTFMVPRGGRGAATSGLVSGIINQPNTITFGDALRHAEALGLPVTKPDVTKEDPYTPLDVEGTNMAENPTIQRLVSDPEATKKVMEQKITPAYGENLIRSAGTLEGNRERRKEEEEKRKATEDKQTSKTEAYQRFSARVSAGEDPAKAFREEGLATHGFTPSQVEFKEPTPGAQKSQWTTVLEAAGGDVTQALKMVQDAKPEPDRNPLDEEYKKLRNERQKAIQNAGDLIQNIRAGKNVPEKEVRAQLDSMRKLYVLFQKEATDQSIPEEDRGYAIYQLGELKPSMAELARHLAKGAPRPGGPRIPAPTAPTPPATPGQGGGLLQKRDTLVTQTFGQGAQWRNLTQNQKDAVAALLNR
jgi:hypothetical protein